MAIDLRNAVRIDQVLHGKRFINIEFICAIVLTLAFDVLVVRTWITHPYMNKRGIVLLSALLVFFTGEFINYAVLFWYSRGPVPEITLPERPVLRSLTIRMTGLILIPGAIAVMAWKQRRSQ